MSAQIGQERTERRKLTLITGASEGIGLECAHIFAKAGHDLALVARRRDRLEGLAEHISAAGYGRPLIFVRDLGALDAAEALADDIASNNASVAYLVNNAGYGLLGAVDTLDAADQLAMIDLNVRSLTALTLRFLPDIKANKGGLLNVASVASYAPGPGMSIYYATKAYVLSFTEGLAQELRSSGVRVAALCPGPVQTGFQTRAGMGVALSAKMPGELSARETAQAGFDGMMAGKTVIIPGIANKALVAGLALLPHAFLLPRVFARQRARKNRLTLENQEI